jgi:hypothetical protein
MNPYVDESSRLQRREVLVQNCWAEKEMGTRPPGRKTGG